MVATYRFQFFAVTRAADLSHSLRKVVISNDLQIELSKVFEEQAAEYLDERIETHSFTPTYTPLDGEVIKIDKFELPDHLEKALSAPQEFGDLSMPFTDSAPGVKAILAVDVTTQRFYFQYFDRSRVLRRSFTAIFKSGMFQKLSDPGITVDNKLAAVIADGKLLFRSFHRVNQFLDLKDFFREATNSDIESVLKHDKLIVDGVQDILDSLSTRMRKRFSFVIASGILDHERATPERIQNRANKFDGLDIRLSGRPGKRKVVFPTDAKAMEMFLRFLAEQLYISEITQQARETNSSKAL